MTKICLNNYFKSMKDLYLEKYELSIVNPNGGC